jgi:hypothetical protein
MNKDNFFTGQPIFNQLLRLIPQELITRCVRKHNSNRYYKKFMSYDHLVAMLYTGFHRCSSLREVTTGMQACQQKLQHLGVRYLPARSTLSDANQNRPEQFFGDLYHELYQYYYCRLPDSRKTKSMDARLFIMDSTTIKLFSDVMRGAGAKPVSGKRKGGAKAHLLIKADEDVARLVCITEAATNDKYLLPHIELPQNSSLVFDMGFTNYKPMQQWGKQKITWITRMTETAICNLKKDNAVSEQEKQKGIISDQLVMMGRESNKKTTKLIARKIAFCDPQTNKHLMFMTNNFRMNASTIAALYKRRWQIELLFKRLKQNYPLQNFLGENENAIKIQIWCSLITDLLIKVVKDKLKRKWSFANIAAMIRLHLMSYIHLIEFLNNPDHAFKKYKPPDTASLFPQKQNGGY